MGKKARKEREEKRESFSAKRTAQKRSVTLKALGILSVVAANSAYASYEFITSTGDVPGAPENAGKLGVISSIKSKNNNDENFREFGKKLSMHIAASNPLSIN